LRGSLFPILGKEEGLSLAHANGTGVLHPSECNLLLLEEENPDGEGLSPAVLGLDSTASHGSYATNRGMVVELKFSSLRR
jgi:hypothetical protein